MDSVLTLSLVILFLPLAGFVIQLVLEKYRMPADFVVDPHAHDAHDAHGHDDHAAHADTAHAAHGDGHAVAKPRGPWTPADQKRAYALSWIGTAILGVCLALSIYVAFTVLSAPAPAGAPSYHPKIETSVTWFDFGDAATSAIGKAYVITLGILSDNLAAIMLVVVCLISFLVHLFSSEYMREPSMHAGRYLRYFAFLGLFTFSMLGIVISNNLLAIYIFWELVGVSSYLLIGFWHERPGPQYANKKAFIANRFGDVGMFAGILILFTQLGTLQLSTIFDLLAAGNLPYGSEAWLTAAGILLFCGAIGKSAQFPLNVWLPDAMEGPTPVSALIHAATMVAAGVYLTARIFPLLTGDAMLFVAAIGGITALIAASIALVQWDLKKVLAFSTVSQLGYMVMALGVGAWSAAVFHLVTHAMFKACLFLASGSVIHQMHHSLHHLHDHSRDPQDMRNMGGLKAKMPVTYLTTLIATLAISGVPLFSGYMSKDEILAGAWAFRNVSPGFVANMVWIVGYVVAGMTAFYMFRMVFLTFFGQPKAADIFAHLKENPRVMVAPLVVLAALSLWIPFGGNPLDPASGWFLKNWAATPVLASPASTHPHVAEAHAAPAGHATTPAPTPAETPADAPAAPAAPAEATPAHGATTSAFQTTLTEATHHLHATGIPHVVSVPALASLLIAGTGILIAFVLYGRRGARGQEVSWAEPRGVRAFLYYRWYQDNFIEKVFPVGFALVLMRVLAWFDMHVVDGIVNGVAAVGVAISRFVGAFDLYVIDGLVNFLAGTAQFIGLVFRQLQGGKVQTYVAYAVVGIVLLFAAYTMMASPF